MDAVVQNMVMLEKSFDVCYCDGDCFSNKNWFKVPVLIRHESDAENAFFKRSYWSISFHRLPQIAMEGQCVGLNSRDFSC